MKHLSNDELLAAVEGESGKTGHLDVCQSCRAQVDRLREVLALTSAVDVPEPSPLFWQYFSDRVQRAVAEEPQVRATRFGAGLAWSASFIGALVIIAIGVAVTIRTGRPVELVLPGPASTVSSLPPPAAVDDTSVDSGVAVDPGVLDEDPAWALMGELASQVDWEAAGEAGLLAPPGAADQALAQMSDDEQRMVAERVQEELQRLKSL